MGRPLKNLWEDFCKRDLMGILLKLGIKRGEKGSRNRTLRFEKGVL